MFFDNFEYVVGRSDTSATNIFMQQGGWTGAKTLQSGEPGARGYLYTVDQIPGFIGVLPGGSSQRVLAIEALPRSLGAQTDFYLQYGVGASSAYDNFIPGNVWFQFWIYVNHYGNQLSRINEGKLLYTCNGTFPCQDNKWLMSFGNDSKPPHYTMLPDNAGAFLQFEATAAPGYPIVNPIAADWDRWKFGQRDISEYMSVNRWTLVKIHVDTSGTGGVYEAWMRPQGGSWVKVAEYIDGVSPAGLVWRVTPGGSRVLRMPTTIGRNTNDPSQNHDLWMYMDDFAIARSESGLPQY